MVTQKDKDWAAAWNAAIARYDAAMNRMRDAEGDYGELAKEMGCSDAQLRAMIAAWFGKTPMEMKVLNDREKDKAFGYTLGLAFGVIFEQERDRIKWLN